MSSSVDLPTCAYCTFVNAPATKMCVICKKSLLVPETSGPSSSTVKECPDCSFLNEVFDNVCQLCGASLMNGSMSVQKADTSSNSCSMCGKGIPGEIQVKICKVCTYYNTADATKCLICEAKFGKQKAISSKLCPFCYHHNTPGPQCTQCTFTNAITALVCVMCDEPLKISKEKDIVLEPFSEEESSDGDELADDENESNEMPVDENIASTVDDTFPKYEVASDSFEILNRAPRSHNYFKIKPLTNTTTTTTFLRAVKRNIEILKTSVPPGVWIKAYEDRMDLLTVMIAGPAGTPYENGLFVFDIRLPSAFPSKPPRAHYISYWNHRLNPNLYVDGKVCLSLLGTWFALRKEEEWGPGSTLLQLIVSIQGLILVEEPYFNEPGTSDELGHPKGSSSSVKYNQKVIRGMIESTLALIQNPPLVFKKEISLHFSTCGRKMYERLKMAAREMTDPNLETCLDGFLDAINKISQ